MCNAATSEKKTKLKMINESKSAAAPVIITKNCNYKTENNWKSAFRKMKLSEMKNNESKKQEHKAYKINHSHNN